MKNLLLLFFVLILLSCNNEEVLEPILLRNTEYISYNLNPGCVGQESIVTFNNGYNNDCGISKIQQRINGVWITVAEACPINGIITYSFVPVISGSYRFRASWTRTGKICKEENIKYVEEEPLFIEDECCRDYFTATALCDTRHDCPYGIEFHIMLTMDNWITLTGEFPIGYNVCGIYAGDGTIIDVASGNIFSISGDFYACFDVEFIVYFETRDPNPFYGKWTVTEMHGNEMYSIIPSPCTTP